MKTLANMIMVSGLVAVICLLAVFAEAVYGVRLGSVVLFQAMYVALFLDIVLIPVYYFCEYIQKRRVYMR